MINIQQNDIIKIFSVAAVVFLPPTLIASIYGMNFKHMPELEWWYAYPIALISMVLAAVLALCLFQAARVAVNLGLRYRLRLATLPLSTTHKKSPDGRRDLG